MDTSYRYVGAGLVLLSLLAGVSSQEEYLPIEAAIEIPEAPKETLCSVKVGLNRPLSRTCSGVSLLVCTCRQLKRARTCMCS